MTMPYQDINSKPVALMTPAERVFDGCFNAAVASPVWNYLIYPIRTVLRNHPTRLVRAAAVCSPGMLFPYTAGMWIVCLVMRIALMLIGVIVLVGALLYSLPSRIKQRVLRWYNSI